MASIYKKKGRRSYIIAYFDHTGKRHERSARTTDYKAASRIAAKLEADEALWRDGAIDARADSYAIAGRRPLTEHIGEYIDHSEHIGQAPRHVTVKKAHLNGLVNGIGATRLADMTDPNMVERYLRELKANGKAARTINACRAAVVAFVNWCVKTGRVAENPLAIIPKLDERKDRRHERRALTVEELSWLLSTTAAQDAQLGDRYAPRSVVYLAAALTGLRRGELGKLTWRDVDLDRGSILIRAGVGKAARDDEIPLHNQVAHAEI